MIKEVRNMFTYEYASQSNKKLTLNLLLTMAKSFAIDIAFFAFCFLLMLLL